MKVIRERAARDRGRQFMHLNCGGFLARHSRARRVPDFATMRTLFRAERPPAVLRDIFAGAREKYRTAVTSRDTSPGPAPRRDAAKQSLNVDMCVCAPD